MKIYLAGGMGYGWQDTVDWGEHTVADPRTWQKDCPTPEQYTERDLKELGTSDVLIAFMCSRNPSGFGLSVEIGYAYAMFIKIIFVDQIQNDWRSPSFGMHRVMATHVVGTLEEALVLLG